MAFSQSGDNLANHEARHPSLALFCSSLSSAHKSFQASSAFLVFNRVPFLIPGTQWSYLWNGDNCILSTQRLRIQSSKLFVFFLTPQCEPDRALLGPYLSCLYENYHFSSLINAAMDFLKSPDKGGYLPQGVCIFRDNLWGKCWKVQDLFWSPVQTVSLVTRPFPKWVHEHPQSGF